MALLNASQRTQCLDQIMDDLSPQAITTSRTKPEWRNLIEDLDVAYNTEAGTLNAYIRQPERANFSQKEKALASIYVIAKRFLLE